MRARSNLVPVGCILPGGEVAEGEVTEDLLPIDRVAKESGLASSALRYYERCGLISAGIKISGRRHYSRAVLHRLSVIKVCQAVGFSLTEIADMLDEQTRPNNTWRELARRRRHDIEQQIHLLQSLADTLDSAMNCDCQELTACPEMGPQGELANRTSTSRLELVERRPVRTRLERTNGAVA